MVKAYLVLVAGEVQLPVILQLGILVHQALGALQGLQAELHLRHGGHRLVLLVEYAGAGDQQKVVSLVPRVSVHKFVKGQLVAVALFNNVDHL
ncbi:hypothetical protein SDC9_98185 [bioreactor metagenome]|uniref:Uncharacterized protein n=1 Tax=bioreactor metagenome TaxID=1076179 RepID=A0A645AEP8_9ZZZZ